MTGARSSSAMPTTSRLEALAEAKAPRSMRWRARHRRAEGIGDAIGGQGTHIVVEVGLPPCAPHAVHACTTRRRRGRAGRPPHWRHGVVRAAPRATADAAGTACVAHTSETLSPRPLKEPDGQGAGFDASRPTHAAPTGTRRGEGAGTGSKAIPAPPRVLTSSCAARWATRPRGEQREGEYRWH